MQAQPPYLKVASLLDTCQPLCGTRCFPNIDDAAAPVHQGTYRVSTCAENAARIIENYGSTGCGHSIVEAVKQNPRDRRDLQMSYKGMANLREVAARTRPSFVQMMPALSGERCARETHTCAIN
jgi:hypothetical protein